MHDLETFALCTLAVLVGLPLLTLVHELGHALVAACLLAGRATVLQGPEPRRLRVSVWRLDLRLHGPVRPQRAWVGWAAWPAHPDAWRHALALAGGPVASALAAAACALGASDTRGVGRGVLFVLALDAACQLVSSALPVRYASFAGAYAREASDGLRIRRLLAGTPEPVPRAALTAPADARPGLAPLALSVPADVAAAPPAARGAAPGAAAARS